MGLFRVIEEYDPGPPARAQASRVEWPEGMGQGDVPVRIHVWSEGWSAGGPNFGMGTAYVFVDTTTEPPTATMLWQR